MGFLFGGDSASTTKHTSNDARVVGGDESVNTSTVLSGDGNTLMTTDAGAVKESMALALAGVNQAHALATTTVETASGLMANALGNQKQLQGEFTSALENVKTSDVRVLIFAALAVVGLAFVRSRKA